MSVCAVFGTRVLMPPQSLGSSGTGNLIREIPRVGNTGIGGGGLVIECSSRPKKKATAHHIKTRPRKTQPWDIKRKPTVYPPLPPLPPDWTLVSPASASQAPDAAPAPPPPPPAAPSP